MKAIVLALESKLLGGKVIRLDAWDTINELIRQEPFLIQKHQPAFMYCEVDATNLSAIHQLEIVGYHFSEFRVNSLLNTADIDIGPAAFYPYTAELIGDSEIMKSAIAMLRNSKDDDRFSNDPLIGLDFSKKRVVSNLKIPE